MRTRIFLRKARRIKIIATIKGRKDNKGYVLRTGETYRADGRYCYAYTDRNKVHRYVYAKTLQLSYVSTEFGGFKKDSPIAFQIAPECSVEFDGGKRTNVPGNGAA